MAATCRGTRLGGALGVSIAIVTLQFPPAHPAQAQALAGQWTRTGNALTYTFVVPDGTPAVVGDAQSVTEEATGDRASDGRAADLAAADVDLEALRAFLRTGAGTGTEVATPTVGQTVYLTLSYRVTGPGAAISVNARALLDGTERCRGTSDTTPNTYERWCTTPWTATAGTHTLRWELDVDNTVAESNEANNAAAVNWTTGSGLDVAAARAYLRTGANSGDEVTTPTLGQSVYFHFSYRVVGADSAVSLSRRALLDGNAYCQSTGNVTSNTYILYCSTPWQATAGAHTLRWELDYTNTLAELDETNNAAVATWTTAGGVDFQAQRAYLRTGKNAGDDIATPQVGQSVYFHFDFAVTAPGVTSPVGLRAIFDDQPSCSGTHNGQAGSWIQWCLDPWVATAGTHTLRWELDYANQFAETNENNNTAAKTWTSGGPACVANCNDDHAVTIDDIITALNVAFDPSRLATCPSADANGDRQVDIDEIIQAVNAALNGCG